MKHRVPKSAAAKLGGDISRSLMCAAGLFLATLATGHGADGAVAANPGGKPASANRPAGSVFKDCPNCPEMVVIPAGSFKMGGTADNEGPRHQVTLPSFALAKTEVTQGQWRALMGRNPSQFLSCGDDCPVESVSWNDAQDYLRKLSAKTRKTYRLPSEAEWEYACRAGGTHQFCGSDAADAVAWHDGNSRAQTRFVASRQANAFGLYDMSGSVWEWVGDCYHDNYAGAPTDGSAWATETCATRVLRGGSWFHYPQYTASAFRNKAAPTSRTNYYGFRPVRMLP